MTWTEPTYARAFITGEIRGHKGLLQRVSLYQGKQAGNKISIPYHTVPTVATVNVNEIISSSRNDEIMTLTATDKAIRSALAYSELETYYNDPSMQMSLIQSHADGIRRDIESAFDTELATSTNTVALGSDNTFTLAKFTEALADPLSAGASMEDCTMLTGPAGWGSMVAAGYANAGGSVTSIPGTMGLILGAIPCIVSHQCTITNTGGPAGYLFAKQGIVCALGDINHFGPTRNSGTNSYDVNTEAYYAFDTVEGADSNFVVEFTNT